MIISKVLTLSDEEVDKLVEAGKVLKAIANTEHDSIDRDGTDLLSALVVALNNVVDWPVLPEK